MPTPTLPPIFTDPPMPTPPATVNAPVVVDVEFVVLANANMPLGSIDAKIVELLFWNSNKLADCETAPLITKPLADAEDKVIVVAPEISRVDLNVAAPVTPKPPVIFAAPPTPKAAVKLAAPVTANVELNVAAPATVRVEPKAAAPDTPNPVPIFALPDTPKPPTTVRAPVVDDVDCVFPRIANAPVTPNVPFTCNLYWGLVRPMPTLPLNSAIPTVPSAFILKLGIPEISDTLNIVPEDILFVIENN